MILTQDRRIDLYFEAHITVKPYELDSDLDRSMRIACECFDMRVSTFLMFVKPDEQPKAFTSMRSQSLHDIVSRTREAVLYLKDTGHDVLRYKIEETLVDSKHQVGDPQDIFADILENRGMKNENHLQMD